ncbi:hypothetical protein SpCBS45565_g01159 [Spizellomyces sp. 'palustris']|nr:hypothetical protein SpCBS45565_g01159 [Spizellomyces sp. 'palustris']
MLATPSKLTELPLRPDPGTRGTPIQVRCNIFPLKIVAETIAYQYDVVMDPNVPALAKHAWRLAEDQFRNGNKKVLLAYDGKKNAFSTANFSNLAVTVGVDRDEEDYPSMPGPITSYNTGSKTKAVPKKNKRKMEVTLTLKQVAKIDFHSLMLFMKKKGPENEAALHATTCLSNVLRHVPGMTFVSAGPNFYSPDDRTHISGGLEIRRGYHQSVRVLMAEHLGVNIDVAATVFRQGGVSLLDLILQHFRCSDVDALVAQMHKTGAANFRSKLSAAFKGANVFTTHRAELKQRFNIGSFSKESADQYTFKMDGKDMSVTKYFHTQYNIKLQYPSLPVVLKSNGKSAFPIEFLTTAPSQRFKKKLNGQQTSEMILATVQHPADREKKIVSAVKGSLGYQNNELLASFGVSIDPNPMTVPARILDAPKVVFGGTESVEVKKGFWQLGKSLAKPITIESYAFAFFVKVKTQEAVEIRDRLLDCFEQVGIQFGSQKDPPIRTQNPKESQNVRKALQALTTEAFKTFNSRCQIIFCVAPKGLRIDNGMRVLYEEIKRITLTELEVLSQCMDYGKCRFEKLNFKYAENVALKVNVKMGGATNFVDNLPLMDKRTMICGADVSHAHAGSAAPSVAAVVASMDAKATRYRTFLTAQPSRVEIIKDMERVIGDALDQFKDSANVYPLLLIFFRDGVSSGQFKQVREAEVLSIKKALAKRKLEHTQVTFIVVQKRHHIRLFPTGGKQDTSGNCLPGTTIDTVITHPTEFDFVLQSHAGLRGTSRPTVYHVLWDENKMQSDQLQQLCYNLCFLAERATRSINMVAPAYRAHLAAYNGRIFLEDEYGSDTASTLSGGEPSVSLRKVMPLIDQNRMYYM